jgi:hypothetical protein
VHLLSHEPQLPMLGGWTERRAHASAQCPLIIAVRGAAANFSTDIILYGLSIRLSNAPQLLALRRSIMARWLVCFGVAAAFKVAAAERLCFCARPLAVQSPL